MARAAAVDPFGDVSHATRALARRDPALRRAIKAIGAPHIRRRDGGFAGLFRIIVEQQVSVASARAIWDRCQAGLDCQSPAAVAAIGVDGLRAFGLSAPKARYVAGLAGAVTDGSLDFAATAFADDAAASEALQSLKGVGPWTAAIYLLFCEGRVDIWPPKDVALQQAYGRAAGLDGKIAGPELDAIASGWSPYRGVAAHVLWTYYAHLKGRAPI